MTVNTCQEVVDLVTSYFEGALPPSERLAFERHVAICPPCRSYLSQMRSVRRIASRPLGEDDLSETVRGTLLAAFADWQNRSRE
jgi:anti-sigma factor RsiW